MIDLSLVKKRSLGVTDPGGYPATRLLGYLKPLGYSTRIPRTMTEIDPGRFGAIRAYYQAHPPPRPAPTRLGRPSDGCLMPLLGARTLTRLAKEAGLSLAVVSGLNTGRVAWTVAPAERIAAALGLDHPAQVIFPGVDLGPNATAEYASPCITVEQARELEARGCGPAHLLLWPELRAPLEPAAVAEEP